MADEQMTTPPKPDVVSEEDLADLIAFIEAIVESNKAFAQKFDVTNLAALRELLAARERIAALHAYAQHLEWCASCAEDSVSSCHDGHELQKAAGMAREETPHD
jgi:hypothetical protein